MRKVPVNMERLIFCWQDVCEDNAYYLDTESGEVLLVNQGLLDLKELTNEIELSRSRYLYIPRLDREKEKQDLRDFMETVEDDKLRNILDVAFESPHQLSAFKKILASKDDQVERLEKFLESRSVVRVRQWLQANCIEVGQPEDEFSEELS